MERFNRIYQLHRALSVARHPVSQRHLLDELECSQATFKRILNDLRLFYQAPIVYDRARNGYHYDPSVDGGVFELPGLWFNADESFALLVCQQLLNNLQPGLLDATLVPLRQRLERLLDKDRAGLGRLAQRMRVLSNSRRMPSPKIFGPVSMALAQRRQLKLIYEGRAAGTPGERRVSPLRLVHYRDNWYLDVWDHDKEALRLFSVDRIRNPEVLGDSAHELSDEALDAQVAGGFGIFTGPVVDHAVLRFSAVQARWVADEQWHPAQVTRWLEDGRYELTVPYSHQRELLMDVLKYGPECEVVAPASLRAEAARLLQAAVSLYAAPAVAVTS